METLPETVEPKLVTVCEAMPPPDTPDIGRLAVLPAMVEEEIVVEPEIAEIPPPTGAVLPVIVQLVTEQVVNDGTPATPMAPPPRLPDESGVSEVTELF